LLSLNIGHSLKQYVNILPGQGIRKKDKTPDEDVNNFETLIELEWNYCVLHHSLKALSSNKFHLLPMAEVMFNKRRGGNASKLLVVSYQTKIPVQVA